MGVRRKKERGGKVPSALHGATRSAVGPTADRADELRGRRSSAGDPFPLALSTNTRCGDDGSGESRVHGFIVVREPTLADLRRARRRCRQMDREGRANGGGADTGTPDARWPPIAIGVRGARRAGHSCRAPYGMCGLRVLTDGRLDEVDEVDLRRAVVHQKSTGVAARRLSWARMSHLTPGPCFPLRPPPPDPSGPPPRTSTGSRQRLHPDHRHLR